MADDDPPFDLQSPSVVDSLPGAPLTEEDFAAFQESEHIVAGQAIEAAGEDNDLITAFVVFTEDTVHGLAFPEDAARWEQFFEAELDDEPDVQGIVELAGHVHLQYREARQSDEVGAGDASGA